MKLFFSEMKWIVGKEKRKLDPALKQSDQDRSGAKNLVPGRLQDHRWHPVVLAHERSWQLAIPETVASIS